MNQPFRFPGMGSQPSKRQLADAIVIINNKYRGHHHILPTEQLDHEQIEVILDGVRDMLYQLEELKPLPPEEDDDTGYGDITTL